MSIEARPLVIITQRVELVVSHGERRDALDQSWATLLDTVGCDVVPIPNHPGTALALARRLKPALLILSGGNSVIPGKPDHAPERNATEAALLDWAGATGVPALGVCRGFQFMNVYLDGKVGPVAGHVARNHAISSRTTFLEVNSYHDYGIIAGDLASPLEIVATAPDGTVEAARHRILPWIGVMWHPERAMPDTASTWSWLAALVREAAETRRISFQ